ncbi:TPA: hypothetical protein O9509_001335 [Staphylococcus aureus]|nr:hypothetical protein [Staphylococcus aureus]HDD0305908.1 hypothetical protein [Staphylococcus aureus]HDD0321364.1 hypothetical protein [Staphylococcus aureus]HDD0464801.1 hypothetical protein [Staphylococcus aureus]HDD0467465.1 hypothetical protein [Staphylococcus aureus]
MTNNTEIRKSLPLEEVEYNEGTATLTFLDKEQGQILQVKLHSKIFDKDTKKRIDDTEQAERAEKNAQEYFGVAFDDLNKAVGQEHDIYVYDRFCSLWEVEQIEKFSVDQEGEIFQTTIEEVKDDGKGIHILFKHEGKIHESKMMYADFKPSLKQWFVNPNKQNMQYGKFKDKFGVNIEEADEIVGNEIMVEVKVSFGKFAHADIKKPKWNK